VLATTVPIHKPTLSSQEAQRIGVSVKNSPAGHIFFVGPKELDWSYYKLNWPEVRIEVFEDRHFQSVQSYSDWMLTPGLYERFKHYEYLLICQTDAILVEPLDPTCWDFDYLGSVWDPPLDASWDPIRKTLIQISFGLSSRRLVVGNGGLSIRKVDAFLAFVDRIPVLKRKKNEDLVISYFAEKYKLRCATPKIAEVTFMEGAAKNWEPGKMVPKVKGFHGLERFNPELEKLILSQVLNHPIFP
jgi:hypothetical protein